MKRQKIKIFFLAMIFFGIFGLAENSWAGTCWNGGSSGIAPWTVKKASDQITDSCELADVSYCVNTVAVAGDTVLIPNKTCTWGAGATYLSVNKSIILEGAGQGQTIINLASDASTGDRGTIQITSSATIKSFTINAPLSGQQTAFSAGSANGWRISDIDYNSTGTCTGKFLYSNSYGLIDNCNIYAASASQELVFTRGPENAWNTTHTLGTADAVYIEDCVVDGPGKLTDFNKNGKGVVRFCAMNERNKVDGHGYASNGPIPPRGFRHFEVYRNNFNFAPPASGYNYVAIAFRGGTGMVFENDQPNYSGPYSYISLHEYCCTSGFAYPNCGNKYACPSNYPIQDQMGRGYITSDQDLEPAYIWSNFKSDGTQWLATGPLMPEEAITECDEGRWTMLGDIIRSDRDYYEQVLSFNGTTGVGVGTLANRSATCTVGVGYWATDQGDWNQNGEDGVLYKCTSTNTWTAYYTPYTYPHPLRNENPSDTVPPANPSGLSVR